jgi:hypothetical protein
MTDLPSHLTPRYWDGTRWVREIKIGFSGTVAEMIARMAQLGIPLSAEVIAETEYEENGPEAFLRWYVPVEEPPQPARATGSPRRDSESADSSGASEKRRGQGQGRLPG